MRFSLRTLLIVMLIAGPLCAVGWQQWQLYQARREVEIAERKFLLNAAINAARLRSVKPFLPTSRTTENEIWEKYQDNFSWESFPESQPNHP